MVKVVSESGGIFRETWVIEATTVDRRVLVFNIPSGDVMSEQPPDR
jgi:hypothetical protein